MRLRTTAATAASTLFGVTATALAAGRRASDAALKPVPGRPLPTEPRLTVHAATGDRITLTRSLAALRPGTYGLAGSGSHAVVGPVIEHTAAPADCVTRRLDRVTHGTLTPGDAVWFTPQAHVGNPRDALGLDHADVDVPGPLGPLPGWFLPATRATWVITVHGLGTTREHPMVVLPLLGRLDLPVLDVAYRGDLGAPRPADGLHHLGDVEWRDVDAAVRYAVRNGARDVVLYGWSTGATMALHTAAYSPLRDRISGLILDSPVLDWRATVRALAAARGAPKPLLPLAVRAAEGRTELALGRLARSADPDRLSVPTLILHGPEDTVAPWRSSHDLAARRPDLVTLRTVVDAPHAACWNADPAGYEEAVRRFLTPLL